MSRRPVVAPGKKYAKSEVNYESPAQGESHCSQCVHFEVQTPRACEIVRGLIKPGDWCSRFKAK